ncbi:MAG: hypothetical protein NVS2B7_28380 [Herpetosiphon sp.]
MLSIVFLAITFVTTVIRFAEGRTRLAVTLATVTLLINVISLIMYYVAPTYSRVSITIATRELLVYAFFMLYFMLRGAPTVLRGTIFDRVNFALLVVFAALIIISPQGILTALLAGRELVFPLATYFLFRMLKLTDVGIKRVLKRVVLIGWWTALFAIAEQIYVNVFNRDLWVNIQISEYLAQKYGQFDQSFPASWINFAPISVGLPAGLRSIGLMLDPLATGHFLACCFAITLYYYRGLRRPVTLVVLGTAVLCTFSKAALMICLVAFGGQALSIRRRSTKIVLLGFLVLLVATLGFLLLRTGDDSFTHYTSFKLGIETLMKAPLGLGIGSTGYFTYLVTGQGEMQAVDTTFSVYTLQMGMIGLVALLLITVFPMLYVSYRVGKKHSRERTSALALTCASLFTAYSILAFSSAAAFTAVPVFVPMMILGFYVSTLHAPAVLHVPAVQQGTKPDATALATMTHNSRAG